MKTELQVNKKILALGALIAWLGLSALAFYAFLMFQDMIFRIYATCCANNRWGFTVTRQWTSIILMAAWVSFSVWLGDYQAKNYSEKKAWKVVGGSFLVLMIIVFFAWII